MRQYYYKNDTCKAIDSGDANCTCWHDEGTGPHPHVFPGDNNKHWTWRTKPESQFIVTINRHRYSQVEYTDSIEKAKQLHDEFVKEASCRDGHHKAKVTIAQVLSTTEIITSY